MLLIFNFLYIMFVFLFLCIYTNPATGCYMNKTILWPTNRKSHYGLSNGAIFNDLERPLTWSTYSGVPGFDSRHAATTDLIAHGISAVVNHWRRHQCQSLS